MRPILTFVLASVAAASLAGCSSASCKIATGAALSGQGLGGPCSQDSSCTSGLTCQVAHPAAGSGITANACTIDCSATACPAGSTCLDGALTGSTDGGAPTFARICLPTCQTDADCTGGIRGGACKVEPSPSTVKVCRPVRCSPYPDAPTGCPSGYGCEGGSCNDPNVMGWCRKS